MKKILFAGLGGGIGVIISYTISNFTSMYVIYSVPYLTIMSYGVVCFLTGLVSTYINEGQTNFTDEIKVGIIQGLLASSASFALFNYKLVTYIEKGMYIHGLLFGSLNMTVCLVATFLGVKSVKRIKKYF